MLDLRWIRENVEYVRRKMAERGVDVGLDEFLAKDALRRSLLQEVEALKHRRNELTRQIGRLKQAGQDPTDLLQESQRLSARIEELDARVAELDAWVEDWLLRVPNVPHESVPVGPDATHNVEVRRWGEIPNFSFPVRDHVDLGRFLGILDLERAAKVAAARFPLFKGWGARLVRALATFMLDLHVREHGYHEVWVPYLVNRATMTGTGQLPKFEPDLYGVPSDDLFLIPTAEVPVTNLLREETLSEQDLPIRLVCWSPCFRREAGTYGQESKGLIRQHQFDKVELVHITTPDRSYDDLEVLTRHAESVLQRLGIPYRVMLLCTGDMGFAAAKTYDIEAWLPSQQRWLEVSSCSNCGDFQARRMGLRYRPAGGGKSRYVHTLNGSGLAIGRTIVVLLENFQQADGSVLIPPALRPYLDGLERLTPTGFPF
jgi:seryl-tRNA synthetase